MRSFFMFTAALLLIFSFSITNTEAQPPQIFPPQGPPEQVPPPLTEVDVEGVVVTSPDHGVASPPFQDAEVVETLVLGEGSWKITASGAANFDRFDTGEGPSPNCGLREEFDGELIMIAKQNLASESDAELVNRGGFSIVGATVGPTTVELVCYGATVFEHNMVAIGGDPFVFEVQGVEEE